MMKNSNNVMENKSFIQALGFLPKENTSGVFHKIYNNCNNYAIEIDFDKEIFLYGNKIITENKTTQNFAQNENWVVLECINRLLEKGYQPQNITLEKTWRLGRLSKGRLDILVTHENGDAYLMIECKTWGNEFEKEFKNLEKNGGQLFSYFQQDKNAEVIMLYASVFDGAVIKYRNEIIKIEEDYRQTGNVKDFYDRWNKLPKSNGVFDSWASTYEFQSKALTKKDLKALKQEDSSFIFNRFLEILRHNVVSDKPNAFNKIFTLFLCKIVDEDRNDDQQLHFQWIEGEDDHISFQKRLTDLYNRGMLELLEKKVTDVSDEEFDKKFHQVDDKYREQFKEILTEIRLKKNNEFAIKEVYDDTSFEENAKVVKEVVELLQVYKIRYNYRQQFLSDFFEMLLTTGLKQESGQFFTPVPIARFIIKSLPLQQISKQKIEAGNRNDLLPAIIDYAAGSGHFITESMEEVQKYIEKLTPSDYSPSTKKAITKWRDDQFDWAEKYVYGIEKDYRLVKTAKVSCYLHGDGLAKIIHGDGLGDFSTSTEFKGLLKETSRNYPQDNKQFDVIISNPPYSVSAFKGSMVTEKKANKAFNLYAKLTDQSSEIECLFIERTKQLLKDGGVAGIILPSSILSSNTRIYTGAREIILKYFDILAITEMGSNTFMATGTNTVTLFLKRRNNADWLNIQASVKIIFTNFQDITVNGIEKPVREYLAHVWEGVSFEDYKTLLQITPNAIITNNEIYQDYQKKIKAKSEAEKWDRILASEQDKLLYFILAFPQKIVLLKTGQKEAEKHFLGYRFSNRRGSEGIHPMQSGKNIDDCTQLYDADIFDNPEKASTYIYKAFTENRFDLEIPEHLQPNISYQNLANMLTFDRVDFEKNISLSVKKKVIIKSIYPQEKIENIFLEIKNGKNVQQFDFKGRYRVSRIETIADATFNVDATKWTNDDVSEKDFLQKGDILLSHINSVKHLGKTAFFNLDEKVVHGVNLLRFRPNQAVINPKYASVIFKNKDFILEMQKYAIKAANQASLNANNLKALKIPLPPKSIQEKIVNEIKVLEEVCKNAKTEINRLQTYTINIIEKVYIETEKTTTLDNVCNVKRGKFSHRPRNEPRFFGGKYPFIQTGDITNAKNKRVGYKQTLNEEGLKVSKLFQPTIVLITIAANIGDTAILDYPACFTDSVIGLIPSENVNVYFLEFMMRKQKQSLDENAPKVAQKNINIQILNKVRIPLPPLSEQQKIVSQIEAIETQINLLEAQIAEIPNKKEIILKKYLT